MWGRARVGRSRAVEGMRRADRVVRADHRAEGASGTACKKTAVHPKGATRLSSTEIGMRCKRMRMPWPIRYLPTKRKDLYCLLNY